MIAETLRPQGRGMILSEVDLSVRMEMWERDSAESCGPPTLSAVGSVSDSVLE